jgi:hypothetical protein
MQPERGPQTRKTRTCGCPSRIEYNRAQLRGTEQMGCIGIFNERTALFVQGSFQPLVELGARFV